MAYGVKVIPQIDTAEVNAEELRKAIQGALDAHTENHPIIVNHFTLTKDTKKAKSMRGAIQTALDNATKENKILIKHVGVKILSDDKKKIISALNTELKDNGLTLKVAKIDANDAVNKFRNQLTNMLSGLSITGLKEFLGTEGIEATYQKAIDNAEEAENAQESLKKKAKETNAELKKLSDMQTVLGSVYRGLFDFEDKNVRDDLSGKIKAALEDIKNAQDASGEEQVKLTEKIEETVAAIKSQSDAYKKAKTAQAQQAKQAAAAEVKAERDRAQQARQAASEQAKAAREQAAAEAKAEATSRKNLALRTQIQKWIQNNARAYQQYKTQVDELLKELNVEGGVSAERLDEIKNAFGEINLQAIKGKFSVNAMFAAMKVGVNYAAGFLATKEGFQKTIEIFKKMLTAVKEVDAAMTELRKVTDLTSKEYIDFEKTAANTARKTGALLSDTINATADFARLGFDIGDAHSLAEAALVYKNVGDGISTIDVATESLISTIKAFGIEANDAMFIVDKFNEVGNNFAISSSGIGEALSRSASALSAAGNDIDESIGLITAMNSVVQNPEAVGTSLKTISMYLRAAKTEAEEAGLSTDGMANSVSELRHELMRLTGVDIMIDDKTFKSTFQIMHDLADVWQDLSDITQANVLEMIGGKRNGNVITSLLVNFEDAIEAMETAQKSFGSATKENEKYLDSINGQITKLKANFQALSNEMINSDWVRNLVKLMNSLLEILTQIEEHSGLVSKSLAGLIGLSALNKLGLAPHLMTLVKWVISLAQGFGRLPVAANSVIPVFSNMAAVLIPLNIALATFGNYHDYIVRQAEKTADAYQHANKTYQENLKIIDKLTKRYNELAVGVDNGTNISLTAKEYSEYQDIIKQIAEISPSLVESYDAEGIHLKDYTDVINAATEAQKDYLKTSTAEYFDNSSARNLFVKWRDDYQSARKSLTEYHNELGKVVRAHGLGQIGMDDSIWRDALSAIKIDVNGGSWGSMSNDAIKTLYDNADAFVFHLRNAAKQTGQYVGNELDTWIKQVRTAITDLGTPLHEMNQVMLQETEYLIDKMEYDLDKAGQSSAIKDALPTDSLDEFRIGLASVISPHATFNENLETTKKYTEEFASIMQSECGKSLLSIIKGMEDGTVSVQDYNAAMSLLTAQFMDNPAFKAAYDYFAGLAEQIDVAGDNAEKTAKTIQGLSVVLSGISKSKSISDAVDEDLREYGYITAETVAAIAEAIGETDKLTKYLSVVDGKLDFNKTAWKQRELSFPNDEIQAYKDQIDVLIQQETDLREYIAETEAYINKSEGYNPTRYKTTDEATSALTAMRAELEKSIADRQYYEEMLKINEALYQQNADAVAASAKLANRQSAESKAKEAISILEQVRESLKLGEEVQADTLIAARNLFGEESYMEYFKDLDSIEDKIRDFVSGILAASDVDIDIASKLMESIGIDEDLYEKMKTGIDKFTQIAEYTKKLRKEYAEKGYILEGYGDAGEILGDGWEKVFTDSSGGVGFDFNEEELRKFAQTAIDTHGIVGLLSTSLWTLFEDTPSTSNIDKLTKSISNIGSIKSLMDTIDTELADSGSNSLDTLGKFIDAYGDGWEKHVNFDNGINITAQALRDLALAGINELDIEESRKQELLKAAEATLDAAAATKELKNSYEGLKTAVSAYGEIGSAQELTYDTIKQLIDVDSQYAKAIEYQNGRLQLNKEKFDEVTEAVKRKALADAEAKAQAILAGKEYQDLLTKMNTEGLTGPEQERLDSLNAQVMAFHVLESEIDNSTSALQRFLNATDRVNAVTYDGAKDAYQTIKDVLYNKKSDMYGMVGHEKFEEAMRLMISPEIEINSPEFKKQFKILEKYFEDSKAGMSTLYNDMLKKGIIDKTTGQINTTVEEAARILGITENALRFAVDQFNQYQTDEHKIDIGGNTTPDIEEEVGLNKAITTVQGLKTEVESMQNTPLEIPVDPSLENISAVNSALSSTQEKVADLNGTPIDVKVKLPDDMTREQLGTYMDELYGGGNVKMTTRPKVTLDDGSMATVLTETFGAGDRANDERYDFQYDKNIVINATPILPDGTIINEDTFREYIGGLVEESADTGKSIVELDSKGIIVSVNPVIGDIEAAYNAAGEDMNWLHMLQEAFYSEGSIDDAAFKEKIAGLNEYIMEHAIPVLEAYQKTMSDAGEAKPDTSGAEKPMENMSESAQTAKDSVDQATSAADAMQVAVDKINDTPLDVSVKGTLDGLGQVYKGLLNIISKLNDINNIDAVANVTVKQTTTAGTIGSAIGGAIGNLVGGLFGNSSASGTKKSPGGETLVGELGPEIAVDPEKNRWYVVGANGPEFVNLPKNAIVFNAEQTKSLFEKGRTNEQGVALASGTRNTSNATSSILPTQQIIDLLKKNIESAKDEAVRSTAKTVEEAEKDRMSGSPEKPKTSSSKKSSGGGSSSSKSKEDEMTVLEKLEEKYQKLLETQEHLIEHQEFLYRQAEKGLDYKGMETSLQKQVEIYKDLMADAQKGIAEMVANGASDTDKELQGLEQAYWDAWDSMYETLDEIATLYVEALQEKMDGIQGAYADFAKAADELAESGGISVDTFQSLIDNGVQYMSLLEKVNGQYVINEDGINKLVAAEKKRLAVESALSYLMQVQQAINDKDTYLLENLANVSNRIGQSSWDAVYAQAALLKNLGLSDDQYAAVLENINALKAISENVTSDITADAEKASDKIKNGLEDQQDALDEILKLTQDLIEHETEERIDAIEEEIDAYRKIIDLKKEALETTRDENDYMDSVAEKTAEIAKLQAQMDQLSLDDSREAAAERASIAEQLKELQKELSDMQEDHSYDAQVDALDKQADAYEESRQQEIADLENSISSAEKLYQASIDRLNAGWGTLYKELIDWNTEVGSSLNSEITDAWERAAEAVKLYGSYSAAIKGLEYEAENGGGKNIVVTNKVPTFHTGGVVGETSSKDGEEVLALLKAGEIVIEKDGQKHLYEIIDFQKELSERLGKKIGEIDLSSLTTNPVTGSVPAADIVTTTNNNDSRSFVFNPQIDVKINHSGAMAGRDAKSFGKQIASTVADELLGTFEASGFMGSMRTRLRQA